MNVNRYDHSPLYSQVIAFIREMIANGEYDENGGIPAEAELEKRFSVSRITIRRAIDELVGEGLLVKMRGKRTTVAPPKFDQPLNRIQGFSETVRKAGLEPRTAFMDMVMTRLPREYEGLVRDHSFSRDVVRVERVRLAGDNPISLITSYIPEHLVPGLMEEGLLNGSLFQTMTMRYNIELHKADQLIEALPASAEVAARLEVKKGFPILSLKQTTYSKELEVVELVRVLSRFDCFSYHTELSPYGASVSSRLR